MFAGSLRVQLMIGATLLASAAAVPASAQDQSGVPSGPAKEGAEGAADGDVIIVTAQKRAEPLQDVPFSISAVAGERLEDLGAEGFRTFANRVPGLQLSEASPTDTQLSIRGVVTSRSSLDQIQNKPTVGLYFDDVSIDLASANPNYQLLDMERVEVLRGPQGTLFGAGSMGGAIRFVTRKPDLDKFELSAGATASWTRYGQLNKLGDVVASVPVIPGKLAVRALVYGTSLGGYIDNIATGETDRNDLKMYGGRLAVRFQPSDRLTIDFMGVLQNLRQDDSANSNPAIGRFRKLAPFDQPVRQDGRLISGTLSYDLGGAQLVSVSSYQKKNDRASRGDLQGVLPLFGLPIDAIDIAFDTRIRNTGFSQEIRLQSDGDGRLKWIVGGFFSKRRNLLVQTADAPGFDTAIGVSGSAFGVPADRIFYAFAESTTKQYAAFAEGTYGLTQKVDLTVGVRVFKGRDQNIYDLRGVLEGGVDQSAPLAKDSGINPKFNATYHLTENNLVYFQAAKGFRLGGGNTPIPLGICDADLRAIGLDGAPATFDSDTLWNYELGSKNTFANNRVTLNVSGYQIDWSDIQNQTSLPCGFAAIQNIGKVRSRGLEVELSAKPAAGLTLAGSYAFTDSKLRSDFSSIGAFSGDRVPLVPRHQGYVSADYRHQFSDWTGFIFADVQLVGARKSSLAPSQNVDLGSYSIGSVRVGVERGPWTLTAFIDNLWDENAQLFASKGSALRTYNLLNETSVRPRTAGLAARVRY